MRCRGFGLGWLELRRLSGIDELGMGNVGWYFEGES